MDEHEATGKEIATALAAVVTVPEMWPKNWAELLAQTINRAIKEAVEAEREACAKVAENRHTGRGGVVPPGEQVAKCIRARTGG